MSKIRHQNTPASYLVLIKDDKTLLLRRANTGYEDGKYSLVAGHVEQNETFTDCIIREAKEEAGIILKEENLEVAHFMHRKSQTPENNERVDVFFVTKDWEGEINNLEAEKCDDLSWFSLENLPENTIPYIKQALENITKGIHYSEHGWK